MARPRKPDHIKEAQGTLQPCRVNDSPVSGILLSALPDIPDIVPEEGREYFLYFCQSGLGRWLTADIIPAIARAGWLYANFIRATQSMEADNGLPWQVAQSGWTQKKGEWTIATEAHKLLLEIEREYGVTLASSQKISIPNKPRGDSLLK